MSSPTDNDVEVIIPWEVALKSCETYKRAITIFGSRKYQSPVIDDMRKLLKDIVDESGELFFLRSSEQAKNFDLLKKQCLAFTSEFRRIQLWTTKYMPNKLAILHVLHEQVDQENKEESPDSHGITMTKFHYQFQRMLKCLSSDKNGSAPSSVKYEKRCMKTAKTIKIHPL
jgi:hypothetical protein